LYLRHRPWPSGINIVLTKHQKEEIVIVSSSSFEVAPQTTLRRNKNSRVIVGQGFVDAMDKLSTKHDLSQVLGLGLIWPNARCNLIR